MDTVEELKEIVAQVKGFLAANMDEGFDPPEISQPVLEYLEKGLDTGMPDSRTLEALEQAVQNCSRCRLAKFRKKAVLGEGSPNSRLVFIGACPGENEEREERPFAGPSGELLTKIIEKGMGLKRPDVYICNIIKCRPPGDRDCRRSEVEACMVHLNKQLDLIKPEVICTLGGTAAKELLGKEFKVLEERGTWHSFRGIYVMPTLHPAYILRYPSRERQLKGLVWEDIQKIMVRLGLKKGE